MSYAQLEPREMDDKQPSGSLPHDRKKAVSPGGSLSHLGSPCSVKNRRTFCQDGSYCNHALPLIYMKRCKVTKTLW